MRGMITSGLSYFSDGSTEKDRVSQPRMMSVPLPSSSPIFLAIGMSR
jgi:hypothetical protein